MSMNIKPCPFCGNEELEFALRIETERKLFQDTPTSQFIGLIKCNKCGCGLYNKIENDVIVFVTKCDQSSMTSIIDDKMLAMFNSFRDETITKWNNRSAL